MRLCLQSLISVSPRHVSPFLRGVIFTRARVSLDLLSPRENEGLLVVQYPPKANTGKIVLMIAPAQLAFLLRRSNDERQEIQLAKCPAWIQWLTVFCLLSHLKGAQNTNCWNPSQDTVIYEFYCDTGKGCDTDVQFWYRLTPSPVGISEWKILHLVDDNKQLQLKDQLNLHKAVLTSGYR